LEGGIGELLSFGARIGAGFVAHERIRTVAGGVQTLTMSLGNEE